MNQYFIILIPVIILILIRLKPFNFIFRTFNTLIHELSHALIAKLFHQKIYKIIINKDFSGSCTTKINNKTAVFFITIVGYLIPSIIGYFFIKLIQYNASTIVLYSIIGICIIVLIFAIDNSFGRIWLLFFIGLNLIFVFIPIFKPYYNHIIYIYAFTLLIENILSIIELIYLTLINKKQAGDATLLAKITHIPAIIWCLLFLCFGVFMFSQSIITISLL